MFKPNKDKKWSNLPWHSMADLNEELENEMTEYMEARLQDQFGPIKVIKYNDVPDLLDESWAKFGIIP